MLARTTYKTIDRFRLKDQDIIRAFAALLLADDYPVLGLQRQGRRGQEFPPGEQSVKMRLAAVGESGDPSGRNRWVPGAFSEKDLSLFFKQRLEEARYAIFIEVLELDRADFLQRFNEGARQTLLQYEQDLTTRLQLMAVNIMDIYARTARGCHLVTWLCHTDWGGDAAVAALREFRRVELEASLEALKTMESGQYGRMRIRMTDPHMPPTDFVTAISLMSQGLQVDRMLGVVPDDESLADLLGRVASSLMAWVMCRDECDPTIGDLLAYLQGERESVEWATARPASA